MLLLCISYRVWKGQDRGLLDSLGKMVSSCQEARESIDLSIGLMESWFPRGRLGHLNVLTASPPRERLSRVPLREECYTYVGGVV